MADKNKPAGAAAKEPGVTRWRLALVTDAEKKAFAAALVLRNNASGAWRDVFPEHANVPSGSLYHYTQQLENDPVVRAEITAILNARTDAKQARAKDIRTMAINAVDKLRAILSADHDAIIVALLGKPASALDDLPEHLRGVISSCSVRVINGEVVICHVRLHDPIRAAEVLQRWVEMQGRAAGPGYTAESEHLSPRPEDDDKPDFH